MRSDGERAGSSEHASFQYRKRAPQRGVHKLLPREPRDCFIEEGERGRQCRRILNADRSPESKDDKEKTSHADQSRSFWQSGQMLPETDVYCDCCRLSFSPSPHLRVSARVISR
jgi:hypothetical protein